MALYLVDEQKNGCIIGNELRKKLRDKPVLNANVLDHLLAHPETIPEEWKGEYIFFWGTISRSSGGSLCVRYLYWRGVRWDSDYYGLDYGWSGDSPAALRAMP